MSSGAPRGGLADDAMLTLDPTSTTADEEALRTEVRSFLADEIRQPGFRPGLGMAAGHDPEFSRRLARRGWVGMGLPAEYGGSDATAVERFVVVEELLAAGAPITAHWIADRQIAPSILRYGSEAQRRRFLPAIAAGECFFSIGMSEPDAGSDLAAVRSVARETSEGWILKGVKTWTSLFHLNDYALVLARVEGTSVEDRQLIQLIVDTGSSGVEVSPILLLTGEHHFNTIFLDDVLVPHSMVLGEPGSGWEQVTNELVLERSGPDRYLSVLPLLKLFVDRVEGAIADDQAECFGGLYARLWSLRQMTLAVARNIDRGAPAALHGSMAKDLGATLEQDLVDAMWRFDDDQRRDDSGSGYESLLEEAVLMAPSFTIRGGTTEILRSIIARGLGQI
jgi:alkylation response protein AidB-like acyl-CoA dehydrogenase